MAYFHVFKQQPMTDQEFNKRIRNMVDVMSQQSIQSVRQNDNKGIESGGIGRNSDANRRRALFSAASASRVLLSIQQFCSFSNF
jgi:superfamily II DNA helicase RecQ